MVRYNVFKNDDGTKTAYYSGEGSQRTKPYYFSATTGKIIKIEGYDVEIIAVRKNNILVRYHYHDGQKWDHTFTPSAFFETFSTLLIKGVSND